MAFGANIFGAPYFGQYSTGFVTTKDARVMAIVRGTKDPLQAPRIRISTTRIALRQPVQS